MLESAQLARLYLAFYKTMDSGRKWVKLHFIPGANTAKVLLVAPWEETEAGGSRMGTGVIPACQRGFLAPPGVFVQHRSVFHRETEGNSFGGVDLP